MVMTRVKELQRIQKAIENQKQTELQWALSYCQMRCKTAREVYSPRKKEKYWYQIEQKVRAAMEASN
jgi:signal recognition particle subunit SEC65